MQHQRVAVALQLVACASFLHERGFPPLRGLLRGARVAREKGGVWLRLGMLPRLHVDHGRSGRRLRSTIAGQGDVIARLLLPLLSALLPEMRSYLEECCARRPAWEAPAALVAALIARTRGMAALDHPLGKGRVLWARQFVIPRSGVFAIDDEDLGGNLAAAARLEAFADSRAVEVQAGPIEEDEIARLQSRAAVVGVDCLVLTTLATEGVPALPLAEGEAMWVLAGDPSQGNDALVRALSAGRENPAVVRELAEAHAGVAFSAPAEPGMAAIRRQGLSSPPARRALATLASSPFGLTAGEVAILSQTTDSALEELSRLRLALSRRGVWHAVTTSDSGDTRVLDAIVEKLPADSPRRLATAVLRGGQSGPLASWCEQRLAEGMARDVLSIAGRLGGRPELAALAVEAALMLGRLVEAERFLEAVAAGSSGGTRDALLAWWAEAAGVPAKALEGLERTRGCALPNRLKARIAWVEAQLAFRRGDRDAERAALELAAHLSPSAVPEAVVAVAAGRGGGVLRRARQLLGARPEGDVAAAMLHFLACEAFARGERASAATALRAALRMTSGENPKLLGEIHADLGGVELLAGRAEVAERHLLLGERWLGRAGSRRAITIVRYNRAVLANDRLSWRAAEELIGASRALRGDVEDSSYWLEELELARASLARGQALEVRAALPRLATSVEHFSHLAGLRAALKVVEAHAALAVGDLEGARQALVGIESDESSLLGALVEADRGVDPPRSLAQRWGVTVTAAVLAAWRRGDEERAFELAQAALMRSPREGAVGIARFIALLGRDRGAPGNRWDQVLGECESVLEEAELDGWAALFRGRLGADPLELVRALDAVLAGGSDTVEGEALGRLARVAGISWLELSRRGTPIATWGPVGDGGSKIGSGAVTARVGGEPSAVGRSVLELVTRLLTSFLGSGSEPVASPLGALLGSSAGLGAVREQIVRWAPLPVAALIVGEPGTGKELVARELHRASGRSGAFVAVNCAGIPSGLLEAELFGVMRGAFTGADRDRAGLVEAAAGGTLFLDEIGELSVDLQAKLLRLLQEREVRRVGGVSIRRVDVRFVAATNCDLTSLIAAGRFRRDLYYRLAVAVIEVPALRERSEDVEVLALHFTDRLAREFQRPGVRLAPATLALLRRSDWPGNVRELESTIARAVAAARPGEVIGPDRLGGLQRAERPREEVQPWTEALERFKRGYFSHLLATCNGNRSQAARRAGVSRQTLHYHLRGLDSGPNRRG